MVASLQDMCRDALWETMHLKLQTPTIKHALLQDMSLINRLQTANSMMNTIHLSLHKDVLNGLFVAADEWIKQRAFIEMADKQRSKKPNTNGRVLSYASTVHPFAPPATSKCMMIF